MKRRDHMPNSGMSLENPLSLELLRMHKIETVYLSFSDLKGELS